MSDNEDESFVMPMTTGVNLLNQNLSAAMSAALESINQDSERNRPVSGTSSTAAERDAQEVMNDLWDAEQLTGDILWQSYQEMFTREMIDSMSSMEKKRLRDYLKNNGAPIKHGTGI